MTTLFLDFDGGVAVDPGKEPYLTREYAARSMFDRAPALEAVIADLDVDIVLSTQWVLRWGFEYAKAKLPPSLAARVVGSIFHTEPYAVRRYIARIDQIFAYAQRHEIDQWVAIETDDFLCPSELHDRLLLVNDRVGLTDADLDKLYLRLVTNTLKAHMPPSVPAKTTVDIWAMVDDRYKSWQLQVTKIRKRHYRVDLQSGDSFQVRGRPNEPILGLIARVLASIPPEHDEPLTMPRVVHMAVTDAGEFVACISALAKAPLCIAVSEDGGHKDWHFGFPAGDASILQFLARACCQCVWNRDSPP